MAFLVPLLLLGGVLAAFGAAPVLIHLINMMRHRRVKWAAMEFLLQSYRRQRNWIFLKQLILLLLRIAVIVLVACLLFWLVHSLWDDVLLAMGQSPDALRLGGSQVTHHYVLLDDSYSMADRVGGSERVFDRANKAVERLAEQAAKERDQRFTLIRFSQAAAGDASSASGGNSAGEAGAPEGQLADFNGQNVDRTFPAALADVRRTYDVSDLGAGPVAALSAAERMIRKGERSIVYVVSDFRAKDWENPAEIQEQLRRIKDRGAQVQLVSCARVERRNLGVIGISPADETRAAGVPLFVEVQVKNYGKEEAKQVKLELSTVFYDRLLEAQSDPEAMRGEKESLDVVLIPEIPPGETVVRRVQVYFPAAGSHVVSAELDVPDDPVPADNRRWCVVDVPEAESVLIVDGQDQQKNYYYLSAAFQPSQQVKTGIRTEIQPPSFLRDAEPDALRKYSAIYLCDVGRLDDQAIENLENYVDGGGGLAFFAGPSIDYRHYNEKLYKEGAGLFPLPLDRGVGILDEEISDNVADIVPDPGHPLFRAFEGDGGIFLRLVTVQHHLRAQEGWRPPEESTVRVAAELRSGAPLVVEQRFKKPRAKGDDEEKPVAERSPGGPVVAVLTTAWPDWNNWAQGLSGGPTFVITMLELQSLLGAGRRVDPDRLVGAPIDVQLDAEKYAAEVDFLIPGREAGVHQKRTRTAARLAADSPLLSASLGRPGRGGVAGETGRAGIYEVWTQAGAAGFEAQRFAVNVPVEEGALAIVNPEQLGEKLQPVQPSITTWDGGEVTSMGFKSEGSGWTEFALGGLIVLLLLEQVLAYFASYHTARSPRVQGV